MRQGLIISILLLSWLIKDRFHEIATNNRITYKSEHLSDTDYILNKPNPSFRQHLGPADVAEPKRFVRVSIRKIINPGRVSISLALYWRSAGKREYLGSAAPYPADHPGSFIIATKGKLRTVGELELRLKTPEDWAGKDKLEVSVEKLRLE